ncbi:hypothetical protein [Hoeflea sp. IMCC20628]|uniref:hypothetical protein n=1 Tax=Hoeflea sp. IMCC20628 TaxID=1620421 RepID=UPI0012E035BE|nr:hypothetical protein [Hoeflea sp. IMCC20628]
MKTNSPLCPVKAGIKANARNPLACIKAHTVPHYLKIVASDQKTSFSGWNGQENRRNFIDHAAPGQNLVRFRRLSEIHQKQ